MKQLELKTEKYTELKHSQGIDAALNKIFNDIGSKGMLNIKPIEKTIIIKSNDVFIQIEDPEDKDFKMKSILISRGNNLEAAKEDLLNNMLYHDKQISEIFSGLTKLVVIHPKTKKQLTEAKIIPDYQYA